MNRLNHFSAISAVLVALLFPCAAIVSAETAADQISAESARLQQLLPTLKLAADQSASQLTQLNLIDTAARSGNLFQALFYLQRARVELMSYEYVTAHADIEKQGLTAFENEWKRVGKELATKEKLLTAKGNALVPAAVRAFAESSLTQVQPYYQSGLLYGRNTTIGDGLYYIGRAPANLDFALFCQQLKFDNTKASPNLRSISTELEALEAIAIKGFQDPNNATKDRSFIEVNSSLKMARELNAERRYAGALKIYLDALLNFELVSAAIPEPQKIAAVKKQAEELRTRLTASTTDQTIGLIYIELVLAAKSEAALKRAVVIVEKVLPSYLKFQSETTQ